MPVVRIVVVFLLGAVTFGFVGLLIAAILGAPVHTWAPLWRFVFAAGVFGLAVAGVKGARV